MANKVDDQPGWEDAPRRKRGGHKHRRTRRQLEDALTAARADYKVALEWVGAQQMAKHERYLGWTPEECARQAQRASNFWGVPQGWTLERACAHPLSDDGQQLIKSAYYGRYRRERVERLERELARKLEAGEAEVEAEVEEPG